MKIVDDRRTEEMVNYKDLEYGDVFVINLCECETLYIKVSSGQELIYDIGAVRLSDGMKISFVPDQLCFKVDAELHIL